MTYAILKCINGSFFVHAEGITNIDNAKVQFHGLCHTLWNAQDVLTATVKIVDEHLDIFEDYREYISHPAPSESE